MTTVDAPVYFGDAIVLADTTDMPRDEWLAERRGGIGGSDAAAICGQSKYRSALEVWLELAAGPDAIDVDNERMQWGRLLEPVVRDEVARRLDVEIDEVNVLLAHPDRPWQRANVDGVITLEDAIYEGKTAGHFAGDEWANNNVPDAYMIQGAHYLAVTGFARVVYGVLIGGQRLEIRTVERDQELIDHLITIEANFWQSVHDGVPPAPDGSKACTDLLAHLWDVKADSIVTLDEADVLPLIRQRSAAAAAEKEAAEMKDEAENRMKVLIGEHEEAVGNDGRRLFTWKQVTTNRLDQKALAEAHPDLVEAFIKPSTYRRFNIPKSKAK